MQHTLKQKRDFLLQFKAMAKYQCSRNFSFVGAVELQLTYGNPIGLSRKEVSRGDLPVHQDSGLSWLSPIHVLVVAFEVGVVQLLSCV